MQTPNLELNLRLRSLYTFTKIRVEHARQLCKAGRKDDARDLFRFLRNVEIISILRRLDFNGDILLLEDELNLLGLECDPLDVPEFSIEIEQIKLILQSIQVLLYRQQK